MQRLGYRRGVRHLAIVLIVVGCSKSDSKQAALTNPPPTKPAPPAVADVKGVLVTASDVLVDGKSLGVLPDRLVTDRAALAAFLAAHPASALTYTDDASAAAVLGAARALGEAGVAAPPRAADTSHEDPQLARQRAIDEARTAGILGSGTPGAPYTLSALANGVPQKICDARGAGTMPDDERVELAVTIGAGTWTTTITRVNETATGSSATKLADMVRQYKQSAFFADRTDVELAAEPGARGADLTAALTASCGVGFFALRPLTVDEVAKQLAPPSESELGRPHAVPTLSIGQPNVQGDLDKAIVRRYIKRHQDKLTACYETQLAKQPKLRGTVQAQFAIGGDGKVTQSDASGVDPAVASCIAGVIKAIEFPKPKSGTVGVNYPFTFRPASP